jgi:hypothetical protein
MPNPSLVRRVGIVRSRSGIERLLDADPRAFRAWKRRRRDGLPDRTRGPRRVERSLPRPARRPATWDDTGSTGFVSSALVLLQLRGTEG